MNKGYYKLKSNLKFLNNNKVNNTLNDFTYNQEFISLINQLSSIIRDFYKKYIFNSKKIYDIILSLSSESLNSKCLLNEISNQYNNHNYNQSKFYQLKINNLNENIDIISQKRKSIEKNFIIMGNNVKYFFEKSKNIFLKMREIRNKKINNINMNDLYLKTSSIDSSLNLNNSINYNKTAGKIEELSSHLRNSHKKNFSKIIFRNESTGKNSIGNKKSSSFDDLNLRVKNYFNRINNFSLSKLNFNLNDVSYPSKINHIKFNSNSSRTIFHDYENTRTKKKKYISYKKFIEVFS